METILTASLDRAVLLAELITQVGEGHLGSLLLVEARTLARIRNSIQKDLESTPEVCDRRRYAPNRVWEAHTNYALSFHERVKRSRPDGWSWVELAAAGGPMSAACLAAIARDIFNESSQLSALNAAGAPRETKPQRLTFAERCEVSGCKCLVPRLDIDEANRRLAQPRFDEPPAKRLRIASIETRKVQDPREHWWRFIGILEIELHICACRHALS